MREVIDHPENGMYLFAADLDYKTRLKVATVFYKMPYSKRGEYEEEIDVMSRKGSSAYAKKIAEAAIQKHYDPNLRPVRVVWRVPGTLF